MSHTMDGNSFYTTEGSRERVLLVGLEYGTDASWNAEDSLDELERLVDTAGAEVVGRIVQRRERPDSRFYVGVGKLEEVKAAVAHLEVDSVVVDDELTPGQARRMERELETKIVDRTQLILDIFAQRARTKEGRLQVELAQLEYLLPRLVGKGIELSRLGGGIGTRGPGETQLEVDRRRIRKRISDLKQEVELVRKHRMLHRRRRKRARQPVVALVGYTNAGKSTLLRALTDAEVLVEDRLFATLDPTIRAVATPKGQEFLLVDTVGFINKLPHQLVAAFRATLEEVADADLILHVLDISSPNFDKAQAVVNEVLAEIGAAGRPLITACNKVDLLEPEAAAAISGSTANGVPISAARGIGLEELVETILANLPDQPRLYRLAVPYAEGRVVEWLHEHGEVLEQKFEADAVHLSVALRSDLAGKVQRFQLT